MRWMSSQKNDICWALALGVLAAMLLAGGFGRIWPLTLNLGVRDDRFVEGFHAPEQSRFRWTADNVTLALPAPPVALSSILSLQVLSGRPLDQPEPQMAVSIADRTFARFAVAREPNTARTYYVVVPPAPASGWAMRIGIKTDTVLLASDPRPLGVPIDWVALMPTSSGPLLPPVWPLFWSAALAILSYAFLRSSGLGWRDAVGATLVLALLLAWGVAMRPLDLLPFIQRLVALPALGCLGVWIARLLAPTCSVEAGRRVVRGADLPIYLAAAWWMGPLFQIVMVADGAPGVAPDAITLLIGGALGILLLLICGGWYLLRGRRLPLAECASGIARRALVLCAVAALAHLGFMLWFSFQRQGPDFWLLFKGTREWVRGAPLYDLGALSDDQFARMPLKVPPFYGMLYVPFVFQDGERILLFHRLLNTALLTGTVLAWLRMWRLSWRSAAGAGVLVLLNFRPFTDTIAFGQIDLALLLVLTLALWAMRNERDMLAGALIALGTLFKIYPIILLAFFVVKWRWRGLVGFALGMLVLNGLAIAAMGWEVHRMYLFDVMPRISGTTPWIENQTVMGFLARLVAPPTVDTFRDPQILLLANALAGLALLGVALLSLRPAPKTSTTYTLQYSQFLLLMVLIIPAAWMHYETLLFVPFAALLLHWHDRLVNLTQAVALALSFGLIAFGNQWTYYGGVVMGLLTVVGISYKFYGMLLLGDLLAGALLEQWVPLPRLVRLRRPLGGLASDGTGRGV